MVKSHKINTFEDAIKTGGYVVLDTETTGLYDDAQIVQIAIVDDYSNVLLDTLVKPTIAIPMDATRIHGITNEMVQNAPGWDQVVGLVFDILSQANALIIYNADYDLRIIDQSCAAIELDTDDLWTRQPPTFCAMNRFAEIYGEWNDYHQSYRWQKLETAARYYNLPVSNAHTALGDCLMTRAVSKKMAGVE